MQSKVLNQVDNTTMIVVQKNAILSDASGCPIPETTQKVVIVPDEDFDEVVRADLQVLKQVWADMDKGEKPFTPVINNSQKKKKK
ncbi:hypothetical protein A2U01_0000453 [Trifolium medium]|uniref:Uncharacterized protein n=1 Tax=Trifolium medium TaxID=97028 RepID=A0A392LXM4_9FABA|nr:hypothetical protein [Trifolium medium]